MSTININHVAGRLDWREWETKDGRHTQAVRIIARTVQLLGSPPSHSNGVAGDEQEEQPLDLTDQDAIAFAAAEG